MSIDSETVAGLFGSVKLWGLRVDSANHRQNPRLDRIRQILEEQYMTGFELECPQCGHTLRIRSEYLGKQGRCKHCQGVVNVEVTTQHKDGRTFLHDAAMKGDVETAELLITHGAGVNAKDNSGFTPLHAAVFCGQQDMADLLMARGARADFTNSAIKPSKLAQDSDISEIPGLVHQGSSRMGWVDQVSPSQTPTKDSAKKKPNEQQFSLRRVFAFTSIPLAFFCYGMFDLWSNNDKGESLVQTAGTPVNTTMPAPQPQLEQPTVPVQPNPYLEELERQRAAKQKQIDGLQQWHDNSDQTLKDIQKKYEDQIHKEQLEDQARQISDGQATNEYIEAARRFFEGEISELKGQVIQSSSWTGWLTAAAAQSHRDVTSALQRQLNEAIARGPLWIAFGAGWPLQTGRIGYIGPMKVFQVIDGSTALLNTVDGSSETVMVTGLDFSTAVNSAIAIITPMLQVVGTKQYTTVIGGMNTVFLLKPFYDIGAIPPSMLQPVAGAPMMYRDALPWEE